MDFLEVIKAQCVGGYNIHLWFNDNIDNVVDLFFKNFHIAYNTIEWANGADFALEYLIAC